MGLSRMIATSHFRIYGFFLSLTHIFTHLFWDAYDLNSGLAFDLPFQIYNKWPFIPYSFASFIAEHSKAIVVLYLLASSICLLTSLVSLISDRNFKIIFGFTFFLKIILYLATYEHMGNYHYMANIIFALYLFANTNLNLVKIALVLFYFGAGLLKLNYEWISGAALLKETFLPQPWLSLACLYVVLLELVLVFFIFHKNKIFRLLTITQLVCFHAFSWHIVGFYYPLVMFCMLTVFLIQLKLPFSFTVLKSKSAIAFILTFLAAQAYPKFLNKNESLTGEGRMLSLNMLDAKTICLPSFEIQTEDGYLYIDEPKAFVTRIRCDPLVWYNFGKDLCDTDKQRIHLTLRGKKTTDRTEKLIVNSVNICDPSLTYSIFRNNWVKNSNVSAFFTDRWENAEVWRSNPERTGHFKTDFKPLSPPQYFPQSFQIGFHSAAKSSPIGLENESFVIASDANQLNFVSKSNDRKRIFFAGHSYGIHGSPATLEDRFVIIGNYNGILSLIDSRTSRRIWANKVATAIGSSPLIFNNRLFISTEDYPQHSRLIEIDIKTGEVIQQSETFKGFAHSSPAAALDTIVFGTNEGLLIALSAQTFQKIWERKFTGKIQSTPVIFNGSVFITSSVGELAKIELKTGHIQNETKLPYGSRATISIDEINKIIIVPDEAGNIYAYDEKLESVIWKHEGNATIIGSGLITGKDDHILYWNQCAKNKLCALKTQSGSLEFGYELEGSFSGSPFLHNDKIIISLDDPGGYYYLYGKTKSP